MKAGDFDERYSVVSYSQGKKPIQKINVAREYLQVLALKSLGKPKHLLIYLLQVVLHYGFYTVCPGLKDLDFSLENRVKYNLKIGFKAQK